jgi:hypothetical protein
LHDSEERIATIQQDLLRTQSAISAERIAQALLKNPSAEMVELQPLHNELRMLIQTVDGPHLSGNDGALFGRTLDPKGPRKAASVTDRLSSICYRFWVKGF